MMNVRTFRGGLGEALRVAAASRLSADSMSVAAIGRRRMVARRLVEEGFCTGDVATLLGVSYGRAAQLIGTAVRKQPRAPNGGLAHQHQHQRGSADHSSFQHEAFLYRGTRDFLDQTVPFVLEAVKLDQPVMVAVSNPRLELMRKGLGADADAVHLVDMAELGGNPARIINGWQAFMDEYPGQPLRGVGEPVWAGRRSEEIGECQLHESLLNLAVAPDTPMWLRCPYDIATLDEPIIEEAARSHPALVQTEGYRGSTAYGGAHHAETTFAKELPEAPTSARQVVVGNDGAAGVRLVVTRAAAAAGIAPARRRDLGAAITELATLGARHGGGSATVRTWERQDALVCEVRDPGHTSDPLIGRRTRPPHRGRGHGVWLANQLCDLVQTRSTDQGTTVRVFTWR